MSTVQVTDAFQYLLDVEVHVFTIDQIHYDTSSTLHKAHFFLELVEPFRI